MKNYFKKIPKKTTIPSFIIALLVYLYYPYGYLIRTSEFKKLFISLIIFVSCFLLLKMFFYFKSKQSMKQDKKMYSDNDFLTIALLIAFATFFATMLIIFNPEFIFLGLQFIVPTVLLDFFILGSLSIDTSFTTQGKYIVLSFALFRYFLYGFLFSSIIHYYKKDKFLNTHVLKKSIIIFLVSLLVVNIIAYYVK